MLGTVDAFEPCQMHEIPSITEKVIVAQKVRSMSKESYFRTANCELSVKVFADVCRT